MALEQRLRPRKEPVQTRALETRQRILEAAARVFALHGYASGTTNRIAAEARMSVGSLYQYFPNKDSILVELSRVHFADSLESIAALLDADSPLPFEERLRSAIEATVALHSGDPRLHQVLFEQAPRPVSFLDELHDAEELLVDHVAGLLDAEPSVQVPDLQMAARMVVATVESLVHRFVARPHDDLDLDAFTDELTRMVTGYLRSNDSSTQNAPIAGRSQNWSQDTVTPATPQDIAV